MFEILSSSYLLILERPNLLTLPSIVAPPEFLKNNFNSDMPEILKWRSVAESSGGFRELLYYLSNNFRKIIYSIEMWSVKTYL